MQVNELLEKTKNKTWQEKLELVSQIENATFSTSFSIEDQVILDFIAENKLDISIFTLDTGRLPNETYTVWEETLLKYKIKIGAYYPDAQQISQFVEQNGINSFYDSVDLRHQCCNIRKVIPLNKALQGKHIWISGVRKEHSISRKNNDFFEFNEDLKVIKFYPLLEEDETNIWKIIKEKNIPYNKLYDKGYRSIGCAPCSRAIEAGEDLRAGRWWWEQDSSKECGLHMVNGKLVRKNVPQ